MLHRPSVIFISFFMQSTTLIATLILYVYPRRRFYTELKNSIFRKKKSCFLFSIGTFGVPTSFLCPDHTCEAWPLGVWVQDNPTPTCQASSVSLPSSRFDYVMVLHHANATRERGIKPTLSTASVSNIKMLS